MVIITINEGHIFKRYDLMCMVPVCNNCHNCWLVSLNHFWHNAFLLYHQQFYFGVTEKAQNEALQVLIASNLIQFCFDSYKILMQFVLAFSKKNNFLMKFYVCELEACFYNNWLEEEYFKMKGFIWLLTEEANN